MTTTTKILGGTNLGKGKGAIHRRQLAWAERCGVPTEAGYCLTPERNLPWLSPRIRADVQEGDGNEFGTPQRRGKICALHSSSALGLNVFGYWQDRDRTPLRKALGETLEIQDVRFERKFETGVPPHSPNLDVVLPLSDGSILAVESKFTEWFGTSGRKPLRDAYLVPKALRWAKVGLDGAQAVAESYAGTGKFKRLDVPQLLKHMLGLGSQPKPWRLLLVWFKAPCPAAKEMETEIACFQQVLGADGPRFSAMTYQDLWARLRPELVDSDKAYAEYLAARYF